MKIIDIESKPDIRQKLLREHRATEQEVRQALRNKHKVDTIPEHFKDEKEAAEFWDTHSVADYWDEMQEADFEMAFDKMPKAIALEYPVARKLSAVSRRENKSVDELVNLLLKEWLAQKPLSKASPTRSVNALKHA